MFTTTCFIRIAPADCNNTFNPLNDERQYNARLSNPIRYLRSVSVASICSFNFLSAGTLFIKPSIALRPRRLSLSGSFSLGLMMVPALTAPHPYNIPYNNRLLMSLVSTPNCS